MNNFITNSGAKDMRSRLSELITVSVELKFLVGFFYFSGIVELVDSLEANPDTVLKILVGLKIDSRSYGIVEYADKTNKNKIQIREDYQADVTKALNNDSFDNKLFYKQAKFILEMIAKQRIIIRKTLHPNHAKLYIFRMDESQLIDNQMFITGSSNLSHQGLSSRDEFNIEISGFGVPEAEAYFDDLWRQAVEITENDVERQRLIENISQKTLLKTIHPFDAYMFVVQSWLDSFYRHESDRFIGLLLEKRGYKRFQYQIDAVMQALSVLEENDGVILADVVGLGKSIIASLIARRMDKRGIIICPPGLIGDDEASSGWKRYKEEFELYDWEVRSGGNLDSIIDYLETANNIEVIVVDEAHRYRNSSTESYEKLKTICRGRKVILLTATPFNNSPADILALLSLFITPKKSSISLNSNLVMLFKYYSQIFKSLAYIRKNHNSPDEAKRKKAEKEYQAFFGDSNIDLSKVMERGKTLSKEIRDVIEPITIRRNRLDLLKDMDYQKEMGELSQIDPPQEWYYELSVEQSAFYDRVICEYFGDSPDGLYRFKGPLYVPYRYESSEQDQEKIKSQEHRNRIAQDNLYDLIRRQLVRRFESSFGAFRQSIENILDTYQRNLQFIEDSGGKYVLSRKLIKQAEEMDAEGIDKLLSVFEAEHQDMDDNRSKVYLVNKFEFKDEFFADAASDIALFERILNEIDDMQLVANDPKRKCLLQKLDDFLKKAPNKKEPAPKVVIFSEFADSIIYLEPYLEESFPAQMLVVQGNISRSKYQAINHNFDAAEKKKDQRDDYQILLTTDKLSEGFNLNRAQMVINYDIPWNPVRVIQRVGRINRISKKVFDTLYITNFFPTEQGADIVKSREIAQHKMYMIHQILGEDARIFDADEEPSPAGLFAKLTENPYESEEESFYTRMKSQMRSWEESYPERVEALKEMPIRLKTAKPGRQNEQIVFLKKAKIFAVSELFKDKNGKYLPIPFEDALQKIICSPDTPKLELSPDFWDTYETLKDNAQRFHYQESSQSNSQKAISMLNYILGKENDILKSYNGFLLTLKDDVENYGTISEWQMREISEWNPDTQKGLQEISDALKKLRKKMGADYLKNIKKNLKAYEQQVIVAVENRA